MVCVLSVADGVCWDGLNMKTQPWGLQAFPVLCAVRTISVSVSDSQATGGALNACICLSFQLCNLTTFLTLKCCEFCNDLASSEVYCLCLLQCCMT